MIKIEKGILTISVEIATNPAASKSGKTLVVATSHGNVMTSELVNGLPVTVGFNAYIPNKDYRAI